MYIYVYIDIDPCDLVNCPLGTSCEVDTLSNQALCVPSCKVHNGGCLDNETCELVTIYCIRAPCPPYVRCVEEEPGMLVLRLLTYVIVEEHVVLCV